MLHKAQVKLLTYVAKNCVIGRMQLFKKKASIWTEKGEMREKEKKEKKEKKIHRKSLRHFF